MRSTLSRVASELRLEGNLREFWKIVGEPTLLICLPKEARVSKARAKDTFMPAGHNSVSVAIQIDHGEEVRCELAVAASRGKILLMIPHHRDQYLFRKLQMCRVKVAKNRRWVLIEVHDHLRQRWIGV